MQQDGLAGEVPIADPQRPRRLAAVEARGQPPPLIFLPAGGEIAEREPGEALVDLRIHHVGPDGLRALETGNRLGVAVHVTQCQSEIVVGVGVIAPQRQRPSVARERLVVAVESVIRDAEIAVRVGIIGS